MWIPEDEKRREEKREEKKKQMVRRDSTNHHLRPRYNYNTIRVGKGQGTFTLSPATVDFVYWIYHRSPDFHPTATSIPRVSLRQDPPATGGGKVQNHPALCRCLTDGACGGNSRNSTILRCPWCCSVPSTIPTVQTVHQVRSHSALP